MRASFAARLAGGAADVSPFRYGLASCDRVCERLNRLVALACALVGVRRHPHFASSEPTRGVPIRNRRADRYSTAVATRMAT